MASWVYHSAIRKDETIMAPDIVDYGVCLGCSDAGPERQCCILLPHQSPLGIFEHPNCQPSGEWPVMFLCLRHAHWCMRSVDNIHPEIEMLVQGQSVPPLWRIQCRCAQERCGRWHTIYVGKDSDWNRILRKLLEKQPRIPCESHVLKWREDLIHSEPFAHNSPMR